MPRDQYSLRLNPEAVAQVEKLAEEEGRTRSDMLRRLLAEALAARAAKRSR